MNATFTGQTDEVKVEDTIREDIKEMQGSYAELNGKITPVTIRKYTRACAHEKNYDTNSKLRSNENCQKLEENTKESQEENKNGHEEWDVETEHFNRMKEEIEDKLRKKTH